ncbi:hypothetical protein EPA93_12375 [Ktedonosporobacter rubrisoli]|uniref:Uncharacterized protein n=1 Tax=Ktedonosporobacter rubrisoli TaxID=2509675 RepID=A0A4P6JN82_KTERU|nr:hypothetical protein [Ktedonosporobacter rubrisoli]QBD76758.1 hypothetical protein EPA93_12375 [Ktedonosporobacter rubrisoli]
MGMTTYTPIISTNVDDSLLSEFNLDIRTSLQEENRVEGDYNVYTDTCATCDFNTTCAATCSYSC